MTATPLSEAVALDALRRVVDPELGMNIVDLGLVYSVAIEGSHMRVTMTLTSRVCPMGESIRNGAQMALLSVDSVMDADVEIIFDPPWTPAKIRRCD